MSADTLEIRSPVTGTLLHTLNLPRLLLISSKDDIYFTTTKQGYSTRKNSEMEPMSKLMEAASHLYKIPWNTLVGAEARPTTCSSIQSSTDATEGYSRSLPVCIDCTQNMKTFENQAKKKGPTARPLCSSLR